MEQFQNFIIEQKNGKNKINEIVKILFQMLLNPLKFFLKNIHKQH